MSERSAIAEVDSAPQAGAGPGRLATAGPGPLATPQPATAGEPDQLTADLLVEEVSIDGMCGVY
jgi:mycofactocin precursor